MQSLRTGDRAFIRELNYAIVLNCIRKHEPISRSQIAERTGLGRSTVSGIVASLLDHGLVDEMGSAPSTGGRKPEMLALKPGRFYAVGIKLEPHGLRGCLTDLHGRIVKRSTASLPTSDLAGVLQELRTFHTQLVRGFDPHTLLGVGLAIPGLVHQGEGVAVHPHFFPWHNVRLRDQLATSWDLPVTLENDARAGALGERWAISEAANPTFLFVSVGVGIGAGIIVDGRLMEGDLIGAGHLGHTLIVEKGLACHCGLRGCLETVANDAALLRYTNASRTVPVANPKDVFLLAHQGESAAQEAIVRVARFLGIAIGNVVKLLGIRQVVIGGETAVEGGQLFLEHVSVAVRENVFTETQSHVIVRPSRLGDDVWLVGAAALVLESLYRPPIFSISNPVLERVVKRRLDIRTTS